MKYLCTIIFWLIPRVNKSAESIRRAVDLRDGIGQKRPEEAQGSPKDALKHLLEAHPGFPLTLGLGILAGQEEQASERARAQNDLPDTLTDVHTGPLTVCV